MTPRSKRRILPGWAAVLLLLAALCHPARSADAPQPRILVLVSQRATPFADILAGFHRRMRALGSSPRYTTLFLDADPSKARRAFLDAKKAGIDLVFALGGPAAETASREALDFPMVAGGMLRADSIRRGSNATGVFLEHPVDVQMKSLHRFLPNARNVGVLYNPSENRERIETARAAAHEQGLALDAIPVTSPREIPAALDALARRCDAVWCLYDSVTTTPDTARQLLLVSFRSRLPLVGLSASWVRSGALYALDWDYDDLGGQCADMASKVLAGARAHGIPPAPPRKLVYDLNLNSARQMNIRFPRSVVQDARQTFQGED